VPFTGGKVTTPLVNPVGLASGGVSGGVGGQFQLIAPGRPACRRFPSGANHVDRHSLVVVLFTLFTLFTLLAYVNYTGLHRAWRRIQVSRVLGWGVCVLNLNKEKQRIQVSFISPLGMVLTLTVVCITQIQRYAAHDLHMTKLQRWQPRWRTLRGASLHPQT